MEPLKLSSTIKYSKPGTQPPLYVAGSFSSPEWEPQEMAYAISDDDEYEFYKDVEVEGGKEYQYKFRIGLGDWWVLNESSPTAIDSVGNKNNLLIVPQQQESKVYSQDMTETSQLPPDVGNAELQNTSIEHTTSTAHIDGVNEDSKVISDLPPLISPTNLSQSQVENSAKKNAPTADSIASPLTMKNNHIRQIEHANDSPSYLVDPVISTNAPLTDLRHEGLEKPKNVHPVDSTIESTSTSGPTDADMESTRNAKASPPATSAVVPAVSQAIEDEVLSGNNINNALTDQPQKASSNSWVVEKGDTELQHSIDYGGDDSIKQKKSHYMQVQDAKSDPLGTQQRSCTPDIAAEVAESAALIDREQPTPPISDTEAGRIGLRRMSNTPIPEVAKTAAEVADTAAILDEEYFHASRDYEGGIGDWHVDFSLPESARNLSITERNELKREQAEKEKTQNEELLKTPGAKLLALRDQYHARLCKEADAFQRSQETNQMWKDILATREDAVDEASKRGLRHSDLGDDNRELLGLARITSQLYWCKASQARAFPDGNDPQLEADIAEQEDRLAFYQYRARIESGELVERDLGSIEEDGENQRIGSNENTTAKIIIKKESEIKNGGVDSNKGISVGNIIDLKQSEIKTSPVDSFQGKLDKECEIEAPNATKFLKNGTNEEIKAEPSTESESTQVDSAGAKQNEPKVEVYKFGAESPHKVIGESLDSALSQTVSSPVTPFVVGDRQLGHQDEDTVREILTGEDGPSIMVQPATPGTKSDYFNKSVDTATATAIDEAGEKQLKKRKQQPSPIGDRPLTPTSMRSNGRDAKSRNFLKAFWRVVFVDWIGGFIMRLCGNNRHK